MKGSGCVKHARCDIDANDSTEVIGETARQSSHTAPEVEGGVSADANLQVVRLLQEVPDCALSPLEELIDVSAPMSVLGLRQDGEQRIDFPPILPSLTMGPRCHGVRMPLSSVEAQSQEPRTPARSSGSLQGVHELRTAERLMGLRVFGSSRPAESGVHVTPPKGESPAFPAP